MPYYRTYVAMAGTAPEDEQDRAWLELEDRMTAHQGEINAATAAQVG